MDEQKTKNLMAIGEFARLSRLSLKALRLYDQIGLLRPASVDDVSGYRYYSPDQAQAARLIGLLRRLEMPLDRIAKVLELPERDAAIQLSNYWSEVEDDLQAKRKLVQFLLNQMQGKEGQMFTIQQRTVPEQRVATIQTKVTASGLPAFIGKGMNELMSYLDSNAITPSGAPFVVYHGQVDTDGDGPVEICVPFAGNLEPAGNIRIRIEPAHEEFYTRITKAQVEFPSILEAYSAVHRAVAESGRAESGGPREVYFTNFGDAQPDDLACDIAVPLAD